MCQSAHFVKKLIIAREWKYIYILILNGCNFKKASVTCNMHLMPLVLLRRVKVITYYETHYFILLFVKVR